MDNSGELTRDEFREACNNDGVVDALKQLELEARDVDDIFDLLDQDGDGTVNIEEFVQGSLRMRGQAKSKDLLSVFVQVQTMNRRMAKLIPTLEKLATNSCPGGLLLDSA